MPFICNVGGAWRRVTVEPHGQRTRIVEYWDNRRRGERWAHGRRYSHGTRVRVVVYADEIKEVQQ